MSEFLQLHPVVQCVLIVSFFALLAWLFHVAER